MQGSISKELAVLLNTLLDHINWQAVQLQIPKS